MLEQGWAFLYNAGTLIFAMSLLIWAGFYYPYGNNLEQQKAELAKDRAALTARLDELKQAAANGTPENETTNLAPLEQELQTQLAQYNDPAQEAQLLTGVVQRTSYLGSFGSKLEPLVRPLGWDGRIGCAVLASFPAREVALSALGVAFNLGEVDVGEDEQKTALQETLQRAVDPRTGQPLFTLATVLSLLVFMALCAQCLSTLAIIKRETNSWFWPIFTFVYMTGLAYVAAWITYNVVSWLW